MSLDRGTNKVACIADCGVLPRNNSDVLTYTPRINMTSVSGAWLKYDSYYRHAYSGSDTESATVEVSIDGGTSWAVLQVVPANASYGSFATYYIDLAAYSHDTDVRIGFRYSDGGGSLQGWAIDNVTVFVPATRDLALLSLTPADSLLGYVQTGYGFTHQAQIYNAGLDTIHSFMLNYTLAGGSIKSDTISGVNILPFTTNTFTHSIPDSVFTLGKHKVTMWVSLDSDAYAYNDSATNFLNGTSFYPQKKLAIESGEGTYNGWSPRNAHYMHSVRGHDADACLISVHEYDPMVDSPYHDFLQSLHWNYVPYILFDRRTSVPIDSFPYYFGVQKQFFGFADLQLSSGGYYGNTMSVNVNVAPAVDLHGDYRLALVITEDGVKGTDSSYDQVNNYAGGSLGAMDGFESKPNPVPATDMTYDFVARTISPGPEGVPGMLPADMLVGNTYHYTLNATIDPAWQGGPLTAIVLLISHDDSTVLNSNQLNVPLKIDMPTASLLTAGVYPNPAQDCANLYFDLARNQAVSIAISDISGRQLMQLPVLVGNPGRKKVPMPVGGLPNGIYFVRVLTEDGNKSVKLEVLH